MTTKPQKMEKTSKKKNRGAHFDASNPWHKSTYICSNCGKRTRETGSSESGVGLCLKCYNEAGLENEHSDCGGHFINGKIVENGFHPDCPVCRALKADGHIFANDTPTTEKHTKAKKSKILKIKSKNMIDCGTSDPENNTLIDNTPHKEGTKLCRKCGRTLPVSKFWKMSASKDGYQHWCKDCQLGL